MSVSPLQKRTNPSPVPGPSTLTCTSGFCPENSSATRFEIGSTVDDPETVIEPDKAPPPVAPVVPVLPLAPALLSDPPHAAAISEKASTPAAMPAQFRALRILRPSSS